MHLRMEVFFNISFLLLFLMYCVLSKVLLQEQHSLPTYFKSGVLLKYVQYFLGMYVVTIASAVREVLQV